MPRHVEDVEDLLKFLFIDADTFRHLLFEQKEGFVRQPEGLKNQNVSFIKCHS